MAYLLNAFSLQMLEGDCTVRFTRVPREVVFGYGHYEEKPFNDEGGIPTGDGWEMFWESDLVSAIGHQDTAAVLGVPMNRIDVKLHKGDIAFVAQLTGGRLPEGCTTLPEGFSFIFYKVEVM